MIIASLDQFPRFFPLHPLFPQACEFLRLVQKQGLPEVKFCLEGEKLVALVVQDAKEPEGRLKAHRRYIEVLYVLSDTDRLLWSPISTCIDIATEYSPESDTAVYFTKNASIIDIPHGHLCILFPEDAHASAPTENSPKKILLKLSLAGQPS
jgi:YhcH/YjgK/YiaL family protein